MPVAKNSIESFVEPDEFREVVLDVESYPEFMREIKKAELLERTDDTMLAKFWAEIRFAGVDVNTEYTLRYTIAEDTVRWTLDSSPDLTKNEGIWQFEETEDGETLAHFEAEVVTNLPISPDIQAMFAEQALPKMMEQFRDRAESL